MAFNRTAYETEHLTGLSDDELLLEAKKVLQQVATSFGGTSSEEALVNACLQQEIKRRGLTLPYAPLPPLPFPAPTENLPVGSSSPPVEKPLTQNIPVSVINPPHMPVEKSTFPGVPQGSDTVPAWLTPGEFVVNKEAATANKAELESINKSTGPAKPMSSGGEVNYLAGGGEAAQWIRAAAGSPDAIVGLIARIVSEMPQGIGELVSGTAILDAGKKGTMPAIIEGAGKEVESFGKAVGSTAIKWTGEFIQAIGSAAQGAIDFARGLHDANMKFAEFSGSMAVVKATQDVRQMELDMRRGDRRAGDRWADTFNNLGVSVANAVEWMAKLYNKWAGDEGKDDWQTLETLPHSAENLRQQLGDLDSPQNAERFGRPQRFGG